MLGQRPDADIERFVVSTAWDGSGLALNATRRTPPTDRRDPGNTHGLAASRTASRRARPTARWSAWFQLDGPHESRKLIDTTTSGR